MAKGELFPPFAAWLGAKAARKARGAGASGRPSSGQGGAMNAFSYFPLLFIPVVIYNLVAFTGFVFGGGGPDPGVASAAAAAAAEVPWFDRSIVGGGIHLPTGGVWVIKAGDVILAMSLLFLFIELLKSTSTGRNAIINHTLSMIIFIFCLVEFLIIPAFASSVFFLITMMTLLDVLAGFIVTIITARRDIAVGEDFGH